MTWNDSDAKAWETLLEKAPLPVALQQSYAYGEAFKTYNATLYRGQIFYDGQCVALCQLIRYRLLKIIPFIVAFKGPVWLTDLSKKKKQHILLSLKKNLPVKKHLFALESNLDNKEKESAYNAGYRRVITGASTIWINLNLPIETLRKQLDGKWRNALVKAEKSNLIVKKIGKKQTDYQWLIDAENTQRKRRGYWALPKDFIADFVDRSTKSQPLLTLAAKNGKTHCAGMMFLIHGKSATYHLGWSNDTGRQHNAHNLLLWQAIKNLKEQGIEWLDLGGVNSHDIPGLTRFKLGSGGDVKTYAGTFMPKIFG